MFWTEESIAFLRDAAAINRYYETIAERIAPQLPENAHICDAGCGIGELSLALKPYCHHVTAVDAAGEFSSSSGTIRITASVRER